LPAGADAQVARRYGSAAQKAQYLPKCIAGECILAIAMTEPGAGSDLQGLNTKATQVEGGWLLDGAKTYITNGASADLIVVVARTNFDKPAAQGRVRGHSSDTER
jgi:acyl-CoA dehydrogenase